MAKLTIYDSQGNRYRSSGRDPTEVSDRIEKFFFGGVRVFLDIGSQNELVVFFRARETKGGRAEQYYAVYETDSLNQIFTRFKNDLRERIEDEFEMTLQTTSDDVEVFSKLDGGKGDLPGSREDHRMISSLVGRGESLQIRTRDASAGLALLYEYTHGDADTLAIAENARITELSDCDLTIELDGDAPLSPIGETESLFDDYREQRSAGGGSQEGTDRSSRPRATTDSNSGSTRSQSRSVVFMATVGIAGLLVLGVLAVALVNAAALYGVSETDSLDPIVIVDGEEPDPELESVAVTGESTQLLTDGGEFVDHATITVNDDDGFSVSGDADGQERAYVAVTRDDEVIAETETDIDGGLDSIEVGPLTDGDAELLIAVGDDPASGDDPAIDEEVSITIEGVEET